MFIRMSWLYDYPSSDIAGSVKWKQNFESGCGCRVSCGSIQHVSGIASARSSEGFLNEASYSISGHACVTIEHNVAIGEVVSSVSACPMLLQESADNDLTTYKLKF